MHAVCNLASYPHSIEHSNDLAPPNHKPAGNLSLQITAKGCAFTTTNIGSKTVIHTFVMVNMNFHQTEVNVSIIKRNYLPKFGPCKPL